MFYQLDDLVCLHIFDLILSLLNQADLFNCRLVCRPWNEAIIKYLQRNQWKNKKNLLFLRSKKFHVGKTLATFVNKSSSIMLSETLIFSQQFIYSQPFECVPQLLSYFSNLKYLTFDYLRLLDNHLHRLHLQLHKMTCLKSLIFHQCTFAGDILNFLSLLHQMDLIVIIDCYCEFDADIMMPCKIRIKNFQFFLQGYQTRDDNLIIGLLKNIDKNVLQKLTIKEKRTSLICNHLEGFDKLQELNLTICGPIGYNHKLWTLFETTFCYVKSLYLRLDKEGCDDDQLFWGKETALKVAKIIANYKNLTSFGVNRKLNVDYQLFISELMPKIGKQLVSLEMVGEDVNNYLLFCDNIQQLTINANFIANLSDLANLKTICLLSMQPNNYEKVVKLINDCATLENVYIDFCCDDTDINHLIDFISKFKKLSKLTLTNVKSSNCFFAINLLESNVKKIFFPTDDKLLRF